MNSTAPSSAPAQTGASASNGPKGALAGFRVLDLSRVLAGPYATQTLGDLGAEVIKIERPGSGDEARNYGPALRNTAGEVTGEGAMFVSANRNKRSVAIDLASASGQRLLRELAACSDVLVENFKAGTLAAYGLDYASLAAVNPRLVYCSITGYGQSGPYAERPGYDTLFQAQSGMMSLTGLPEEQSGGGPLRVGFALADMFAAHQAAIAIQAALLERVRSGRGQHIDLSLLDGATAVLSHVAQGYLLDGKLPKRMGNGSGATGPAEVLECRDGQIYVTAPSNSLFARLAAAIGQPALARQARFATPRLRAEARPDLLDVLLAFTRPRSRQEVVDVLVAAGVPAGFVNDLRQALDDPHASHRGATVTLPHALNPGLQVLASPLRLARTPPQHALPPPVLGQHTDEVLGDVLGMSAAALASLRAEGAIA